MNEPARARGRLLNGAEMLLAMAIVATGLGIYQLRIHEECYTMLAALALWVAFGLEATAT